MMKPELPKGGGTCFICKEKCETYHYYHTKCRDKWMEEGKKKWNYAQNVITRHKSYIMVSVWVVIRGIIMAKCLGCEVMNAEKDSQLCKECSEYAKKYEGCFECIVCQKKTDAVNSGLCKECRDNMDSDNCAWQRNYNEKRVYKRRFKENRS